jgi:hypothetical protein
VPPTFSSTRPRLGGAFRFLLEDGTPDRPGLLLASAGPGTPQALGSGCVAQVDLPTHFQLLPILTDASGTWSLEAVLPNAAGLAGGVFTGQAVLFGTGAPLGFDVSNGLQLTFGY